MIRRAPRRRLRSSSRRRRGPWHAALAGVGALLLSAAVPVAPCAAAGDPERGRAVFESAGGCTCHTNLATEGGEGEGAPWLAGGRALSTPFGVYYSTNITPDRETGIGGFGEADFLRAMQEGRARDGSNYFPVFPYPSFTHMTDADLRDLYAYLRSVPAVRRENRPPEALPPFRWRLAVTAWKWLEFSPGRFVPDPARDAEWNRGAYLVSGPGHCGECHTPRTASGGVDASRALIGSLDGPEGERAPNLTPDPATGLGEWSRADVAWYLETGLKPDGDDTQGLMAELIEHGFSKLGASDRNAIAAYLESLGPVHNALPTKR